MSQPLGKEKKSSILTPEEIAGMNFLEGMDNLPDTEEFLTTVLGKKNSRFVLTDEPDLNETMLNANYNAYFWRAISYARKYERNPEVVKKALEDITLPFLRLMIELGIRGKKILFAGCGTARDLQTALMAGFEAFGIDYSPHMIIYAQHFINTQIHLNPELALLSIEEMANLDMPGAFGGVFLESALAHVKKKDAPQVLNDCADLLEVDGLCLVGFRLTADGNVYFVEEPELGIRYFTSLTEEQAYSLVDSTGRFRILKVEYKEHPVPERPGFLNMYLQKIT